METKELSREQRLYQAESKFTPQEKVVLSRFIQIRDLLGSVEQEIEQLENMGALVNQCALSCAIVERSHLRDLLVIASAKLVGKEAKYFRLSKEETDKLAADIEQVLHKRLGEEPASR